MNQLYKRRVGWAGLAVVGVAGLVAAIIASCNRVNPPPPVTDRDTNVDIGPQVHAFCGACHQYPPPDSFPRDAWREEVDRAYGFFRDSGLEIPRPGFEQVVKYYEARAPLELQPAKFQNESKPAPVNFEHVKIPTVRGATPPAISNVNLVHLFDDEKLDVLACEMRHGMVMALRPYDKSPTWELLYKGPKKGFNPAHAELVDLRRDGHKDILVANLGS